MGLTWKLRRPQPHHTRPPLLYLPELKDLLHHSQAQQGPPRQGRKRDVHDPRQLHPDKAERLRAMWNYFVEGKKDAISLAKFPNGSETPERLAQIRAEEERKRNGGKRRLLVHQDVTPDEAEN